MPRGSVGTSPAHVRPVYQPSRDRLCRELHPLESLRQDVFESSQADSLAQDWLEELVQNVLIVEDAKVPVVAAFAGMMGRYGSTVGHGMSNCSGSGRADAAVLLVRLDVESDW